MTVNVVIIIIAALIVCAFLYASAATSTFGQQQQNATGTVIRLGATMTPDRLGVNYDVDAFKFVTSDKSICPSITTTGCKYSMDGGQWSTYPGIPTKRHNEGY